jgi:3-oxoacyl-[acyl-carrier-protein] synthase-3
MNSQIQQKEDAVASVLRQLVMVWSEFESRLNQLPIVDKMNRKKLRLEDYQLLLLNHRQQVIEGGRWIALAASSVTHDYAELRSDFIKHAHTEHRDFRMLEKNYVATGGKLEDIQSYPKNIGSEALSAWMFHRASQPNPFDLLGAMFIIEGLGKHIASYWADNIKQQLRLEDKHVSFYTYHGEHDDGHLEELEDALRSGILDIPDMAQQIIKTAKVTGRLYLLQLEELGNC